MDSDCCPADPSHAADLYCLGRLSSEDAQAFEDHYMTCSRCAAVVEATDRFISGLRAAAERGKPGVTGPA